ncbi:MAG: DUF262 domain-containing protein [Bacteroidaceae bacterium]|nr:DUF262 domain-containing protein [Bacteroidaceae bacterium]
MDACDQYLELDTDEDVIIEAESQGTELISVPFNPQSIRIRRDPFTLGELVDKIQYSEVRFDTPYQRKENLWDDVKQSRLIESLLLRLPLPAFYFDEIEEQKQIWNVIDGLQRCSVFYHFLIKKDLVLTGLEFLGDDYNGKSFDDLPRELHRRIMQTPLSVYVVEIGTPDEVKYNIFKRINTGGLILTPQEIRHAMNQGIAAEFVAKLASKPLFKEATCCRIPTERMEDQDFITRFVAFYILGPDSYAPDLDSYLTKGMGAVRSLTPAQRDCVETDFIRSMATALAIFGTDAFRKRISLEERRHPLNKTLFEVISVCLAKLSERETSVLIEKKDIFCEKFREANKDSKFVYSITSGTGNKDSVKNRYSVIKSIIDEVLNIN